MSIKYTREQPFTTEIHFFVLSHDQLCFLTNFWIRDRILQQTKTVLLIKRLIPLDKLILNIEHSGSGKEKTYGLVELFVKLILNLLLRLITVVLYLLITFFPLVHR